MAAPLKDVRLCGDFSQFMDKLESARLVDNRIVHELNTTIPTASFAAGVDVAAKCKNLHEVMHAAHEMRVEAIKGCIETQADKLKSILDKRMADPENFQLRKHLGREQTNLRLFQQELNVEEIIQERAKKVFYERCRDHYAPQSS